MKIHQSALILSVSFVTLALASCNTAPAPPPVPRVPAVTLKPIADNNAAIKRQNQSLRQTNTALQAKIDAAIVAAHQARLEAAKPKPDAPTLNKELDTVDESQAAVKELAARQSKTIDEQGTTITTQDTTIKGKQAEVDNVKRLADKQSSTLDARNQEVANDKLIIDQVDSYWGLGAFWYGIKRLGWHLLIVVVVLGLLGFLLNSFVPLARPAMAIIIKFFAGVGGMILALLKKLWPFKTKPPTP